MTHRSVGAIAALVLVAAACGGGGDSAPSATAVPVAPPSGRTTTTAPGATLPPPVTTLGPIALIPAEDINRAARVLVRQNRQDVDRLIALIRSMGATGDPRWAPYLLDLRIISVPEVFGELRDAFAAVSGVAPPGEDDALFLHYGDWLYDEGVDPGSDYVLWKSELYSLIDAAFVDLILQVDDPVLAGQLQWGGTTVGGIPELNDQRTIGIDQAEYMLAGELTFGAVINGAARSYPHRILDFHELANDTLGGEPVALANCTLCRTGMLFSRKVGDRVLDFKTSGLLWNSNKVMVDVQTGTLWRQLTGEAIAGELEGTVLDVFPMTVTLYADWIAEHPESDVLAIPGGDRELNVGDAEIPADVGYSYEPGAAYTAYYGSESLWFPTFDVPDVFDPKEQVATLDLGGARIAVGLDDLADSGPQLVSVGDRSVLVVPTGAGARFYAADDPSLLDVAPDGSVILPDDAVAGDAGLTIGEIAFERLTSSQSFWFAWHGNFPDTAWWPGT